MMETIIACPRCFRVSLNPSDAVNRYCAACKIFWADVPPARPQQGVAEFDCVGCGAHVYSIHHPDDVPTCATCRFICEQLEEGTMSRDEAVAMRAHLMRHVEASR